MFDSSVLFDDRPSVVEEALRRWLAESDARTGSAAPTDAASPGSEEREAEPPGAPELRQLLDTGAEHLAAAKAAHREQARQAAVQARSLAAFARCRPAAVMDRPDDEVGAAAASRAARPEPLTAVSEWAVDEVMVALGLSSPAAQDLLTQSVVLAERLPATLAALEDGAIGWAHARVMAERVGLLQPETRAEVERGLLARAEGKTLPLFKAAVRRAVLRADAAAAVQRAAMAVRERHVSVYPGEDGMATLSATLPAPVALACRNALEAYAEESVVPGDGRTKAQRMVDCLADLILRPGAGDRPPVQVQLTVIASVNTLTGGDEPGEVDGNPVPAAMVRELAHALGLLPRPEPLEARTPPAVAPVTPTISANEQAAADLAALLGLTTVAGTALAQLPAIAVVEELSGQLLALTDTGEIRRTATCGRRTCRTGRQPCTHPPGGPGLGQPPDTPRYTPSDRLARFVRARDRRCRFPGCRARAIVCDLDHNLPWPQGTTSAGNLCCLCRHHHRLSHQAPGWSMRRLPDGGLQWTLPSGEHLTTYPLRYGTDDDLGPPESPPLVQPPLTARGRVLGRPRPPGVDDPDPAPF